MFASRRFLAPACALALLVAGAMNGCAGSDCLRDSDCDAALECRRGTCQKPIPKTIPGDGGDVDGGDAAASGGSAGHANGSAGRAGHAASGDGGEAGSSVSQ